MKKYFYKDADKNIGPLTFEELTKHQVTKETKVWYPGLGDWTTANELPELKQFLNKPDEPINLDNTEYTHVLIKNITSEVKDKVTIEKWKHLLDFYGRDKYIVLAYFDKNGKISTEHADPVEKDYSPKTYLAESILVTIFCCVPFGIVGIVHAANVSSRYFIGDIEGSLKAQKEARKWTLIGFWTGLAFGILYIAGNIFIGFNSGAF
jgi:hypothetical protein